MRPLEVKCGLEEKVLVSGEKEKDFEWSIREECRDYWDDKEVFVGYFWGDQCGWRSYSEVK